MKRQFLRVLILVSMLSAAQMPRLAAQVSKRANSTPTPAAQTAPQADSQAVTSPSAVVPALPVPRLLKFAGVLKDDAGTPRTGVVGISFSVYKNQEGGSALWMETQNIELDALGNYTVLLGSTKPEGMPLDLFSTGESRWLGVKVELNNEVEQARVLLVSVPYALKASDSDTLGGKPASAYLLAPEATSATGSTQVTAPSAKGTATTSSTGGAKNAVPPPTITTSYIPMFTNSSGSLGNSALFQSSTGNIGIGSTTPNARLAVTAPSGGTILNATNLTDQDMQIVLSVPGASDKHTYFGPSTNTNLTLGVGGAEKMRITNSGNVGIGSSNPNARLAITASGGGTIVNATNLNDQDMQIVLSAPGASDKHTYFGPSTSTNLTLGVASTEMMRITNTGSVGIGTSTPGYTLDVGGTGVNTPFLSANSASADAINAFTGGTSSAAAVYGVAYAGTGSSLGVAGFTGSSEGDAYGVGGFAYAGSGDPIGVYGRADGGNGVGVFGQYGGESANAANWVGTYTAGVWGDGGNAGKFGVLGTADDNNAGAFSNNSDFYYALWAYNYNNAGFPFGAFNNLGLGCWIDPSGNINCSGTKNAVVPVDGGKRSVALSAIESPQNWFEDAGSAHLVNGEAVVEIDSEFMQTVNTGQEYQVFLTPYGDCKGLYVSDRTPNSFTVHELGSGTASLSFGYRIMALRRTYESIRFADHTKDQEVMQRALARQHGVRPTGNVSHTPRKPMLHTPRQISLSSPPHNMVK